MYYTIGWNMPGYLPDMEPYTVDTADEAKRAMIDELLRHADQVDEGDSNLADEISHKAEDLNLCDVSTGWGETVGGLAYWIEPVPFDNDGGN